jgi:hypothetical protein
MPVFSVALMGHSAPVVFCALDEDNAACAACPFSPKLQVVVDRFDEGQQKKHGHSCHRFHPHGLVRTAQPRNNPVTESIKRACDAQIEVHCSVTEKTE